MFYKASLIVADKDSPTSTNMRLENQSISSMIQLLGCKITSIFWVAATGNDVQDFFKIICVLYGAEHHSPKTAFAKVECLRYFWEFIGFSR